MVHLLFAPNIHLGGILNVHTSSSRLPDLQVVLVHIQQVLDLLHVDFDQRNLESELYVLSAFLYLLEYPLHYPRYEPLFIVIFEAGPHASVGLPRSCLPIHQCCSMNPFEDTKLNNLYV